MNEILKLLSVSSPALERIGGSSIDALSPADVAAAIGMMNCGDHIIEYVRAKAEYTDDQLEGFIKSGKVQLILNEMCRLADVDWPTNKMYKICDLAVRREIKEHKCKACNGAPVRGGVVCHSCGGTSNGKMTVTDKAKFLGVSRKAYTNTWKIREGDLRDILRKWERIFDKNLSFVLMKN